MERTWPSLSQSIVAGGTVVAFGWRGAVATGMATPLNASVRPLRAIVTRTALHFAALRGDATAARAAIETGADLDLLDELGNSALHWAVFGGHIDVAEVLLDAGADPNVMSSDGVTPCWRAVDFGLTEIETLIRAHGGKVVTGPSFDRVSFSIFGNAIGQPIPEEDD